MNDVGALLLQTFLADRGVRVSDHPFAVRAKGAAHWDVKTSTPEADEALPPLVEQLERCVAAEAERVCALPEDGFLPFRAPCVSRCRSGALTITALGVYRRAGCLWIPVFNSSQRHGLSLCAYLFRSERFCGQLSGDVSAHIAADEYADRLRRAFAQTPTGTGVWMNLNQLGGPQTVAISAGYPMPAATPADGSRWRQMFLDGAGAVVVAPLDESKPTVRALVGHLCQLRHEPNVESVPVGADFVERFLVPIPVQSDPYDTWGACDGAATCGAVIIGRYRHRSCTGAECVLFAVLVGTDGGRPLQLVTVVPPGDVAFLPEIQQGYRAYAQALLEAVCARRAAAPTVRVVTPSAAAASASEDLLLRRTTTTVPVTDCAARRRTKRRHPYPQ